VTYDHDPIPALKQQLARELVRYAGKRPAWNIAVLIGTDQPRISDLRKGKLNRFSLESLIRFLRRAGYETQAQVVRFRKREPRRPARKDGHALVADKALS
jgi:predicted XRE-type DNA-binding protein